MLQRDVWTSMFWAMLGAAADLTLAQNQSKGIADTIVQWICRR
jgi:hypothetical protein